jgi:hypothetical protein
VSSPVTPTDSSITTSDARRPVIELEGEGALALCEGLGRVGVSVSGLDADPDRGRSLYVAAAVTETLRLERFGPQAG